MSQSFAAHVTSLQERYAEALDLLGNVRSVLIHSGVNHLYYADDQTRPFRAFGHFCQWLPVNRPDQAILIRPGDRPVYFQVIPPDYWYDQSIDHADWWAEAFDIVVLSHFEQVRHHVGDVRALVYLGEQESFARELGVPAEHVNPAVLQCFLDFRRGCKTGFEIEQIRSANTLALKGHQAARTCFLEGGSEYDIHMAFLQACRITEEECPYTNIVAVDDRAAILHYQHKRRDPPAGRGGRVLLIDAGCRVNNYCSDITRTTAGPGTDERFQQLLAGVEAIERRLVDTVRPGISYIDLHCSAMRQIASLAIDTGLIRCSLDQAMELNLSGLFMPHGVGHLLGLQVHDVGGHLSGADGSLRTPPESYPFLRNTRIMEESMVFTVEPGFYFIPLLLDPLRNTERGRLLNWQEIDALKSLGGIRIEDNIRVTADGGENLTRQ